MGHYDKWQTTFLDSWDRYPALSLHERQPKRCNSSLVRRDCEMPGTEGRICYFTNYNKVVGLTACESQGHLAGSAESSRTNLREGNPPLGGSRNCYTLETKPGSTHVSWGRECSPPLGGSYSHFALTTLLDGVLSKQKRKYRPKALERPLDKRARPHVFLGKMEIKLR